MSRTADGGVERDIAEGDQNVPNGRKELELGLEVCCGGMPWDRNGSGVTERDVEKAFGG